mmetsp:Transcript_6745/g.14716  ORF Transcript_6745/g.14716 Transcript_6745/m.14716 type:complete len:274 (+) Transcript_6745:439-1260(+)
MQTRRTRRTSSPIFAPIPSCATASSSAPISPAASSSRCLDSRLAAFASSRTLASHRLALSARSSRLGSHQLAAVRRMSTARRSSGWSTAIRGTTLGTRPTSTLCGESSRCCMPAQRSCPAVARSRRADSCSLASCSAPPRVWRHCMTSSSSRALPPARSIRCRSTSYSQWSRRSSTSRPIQSTGFSTRRSTVMAPALPAAGPRSVCRHRSARHGITPAASPLPRLRYSSRVRWSTRGWARTTRGCAPSSRPQRSSRRRTTGGGSTTSRRCARA